MEVRSSFSQHSSFEKCNRMWFFQKVKQIPVVQDMCYADAGNVIHKCLEVFYKGETTKLEDIKIRFENMWDGKNLHKTKLVYNKDEYWDMVLNGIALEKNFTSTELKIYYPDVIAYLDCVNTETGEICDWKSSKRRQENEIEYTQQLKLYCWVYYRKFNVLPKKVTVYYLRYIGEKGELSFVPTMKDVEEIEKWYNDILKEMAEIKTTQKAPPICDECYMFCPFKNICQGYDSQNSIKFNLRIVGNNIYLDGPITDLLNKGLHKKFSYELKDAFYILKANPNANTTIDFWNDRTRMLPISMKDALVKTLTDYAKWKELELAIDIDDQRTFDKINIIMPDNFINGKELRDYQTDAVDKFLRDKIGILQIGTGGGKCFAKGTKILMYDLSVKNVEDIKIGDLLMGDDSKPRKVLNLNTGKEKMYKIKQKLAMDYTVNESHILSLRKKRKNHFNKLPEKIDISLKEYLDWSHKKKEGFGGYKNIIDFKEKKVDIEPYFLGLWLGDGGQQDLRITNIDNEVINYIEEYANKLNMKVSKYKDRNIFNYAITKKTRSNKSNKLLNMMKKYNLINNKHIPIEYIKNSRKVRLELLAGLIDSDGEVRGKTKKSLKGRNIIICQKRKNIIDELYLLANSLGYYCRVNKTTRFYKSINREATYYHISIRGNLKEIPTKIKRKQLDNAFYPIRYNGTKIEIIPKDVDKYYGFEIDGNKRFLLEDCTVVHNTEVAIECVRRLGYKTLFIVDKIELLKQTKKRIEDSLGVEVGQIGQGVEDIKDITVATIQSLTTRLSTIKKLNSFKTIIIRQNWKVYANENNLVYPEDDDFNKNEKESKVKADEYKEEEDKYSKRYKFNSEEKVKIEQHKIELEKEKQIFCDYLATIRFAIFDECHKTAAKSFLLLSRYLVNSEYRLGLSGTAFRDDGNDMMIQAVVGNKKMDLSSKVLIEKGWLQKPNIIFIKDYMNSDKIKELEETTKTGLINETPNYKTFYEAFIVKNDDRNNVIYNLCNEHKNKKILILTKLIEHGKMLNENIPNSKFLHGSSSKGDRSKMFKDFVEGKHNILIATISIFAEGIDIPTLDIVINAAANKGNVKTIQVLGRVLRKIEGKKEARYFDFIDDSDFFRGASLSRKKILIQEGHNVEVVKHEDINSDTSL